MIYPPDLNLSVLKLIGMHMWDTDSYTKQMFEAPFRPPMMVDWTEQFANGTARYFAESRHSTLAITSGAVDVMAAHAEANAGNPLFLYIPFAAAHSPLQPLPQHLAKCAGIPHLWRRQFCGMVLGLDEALLNITVAAKKHLGKKAKKIGVASSVPLRKRARFAWHFNLFIVILIPFEYF
jgi:hypothetical protein